MYVEMRPPNSRHSEPRNTQTASLLFDRPVEEWRTSSSSGAKSWGVSGNSGVSPASARVTSANGRQLLAVPTGGWLGVIALGGGRLLRPAVDAKEHHDR